MAATTQISWCDATFNPWRGCSKVNAGCTNCYAEVNRSVKIHGVKWGTEKQGGTRVRLSDAGWKEPIKWNRQAAYIWCGNCEVAEGGMLGGDGTIQCESCRAIRPRVFCASLADVFEPWEGPILDHRGRQLFTINGDDYFVEAEYPECRAATMDDLRRDLFRLIDATPNLDWLLLTKRPENIRRMFINQHLDGGTTGRIREFMADGESQDVHPYWRRNVWLGASCSDQVTADKAIPELLKCRDLARVLFVSAEPLTGPIEVQWAIVKQDPDVGDGIDLVITGGESGPNARPCNVSWIRDIGKQCKAAGVSWFNKQLGSKPAYHPDDWDEFSHRDTLCLSCNRKVARMLPTQDMCPCGSRLSFGDSAESERVIVPFDDPKGGNMDEWPEDLRVQQLPTA